MARLRRLFLPGAANHVRLRGVDRQDIFRSDGDRLFLRSCIWNAAALHGLSVHAYVLMSNHIHLLATGAAEDTLPKVVQSVGRRYVAYFNHRYGRTGTLWEGRYRSTVIDSEAYFLNCQRYIEQNPVRAGIVADPAEFPWSSHRFNALGIPDDLLTPHPIMRSLGEDASECRRTYRALCARPLPEASLECIREATTKAWVLGGEEFCNRVWATTGRRPVPLPKGRPHKKRHE